MCGIFNGFAALLYSTGASSWDHLVVQDGCQRPAIASHLQATTSSLRHFSMHPCVACEDARPPHCESGRQLQTSLKFQKQEFETDSDSNKELPSNIPERKADQFSLPLDS